MPICLGFVAFSTGFASLATQFIYNRLIFFYIANSEYAAANIITLHLLGFLVGTLLGRRLTISVGALLWSMLAVTFVAYVMVWELGVEYFGLLATLLLTVILSLINALLAGWVILSLMHQQGTGPRHAGGIMIADSAGSVVGAAIAGFILVPRLGLDNTFSIVMGVMWIAWAAWIVSQGNRRIRKGIAAAVSLVAVFMPQYQTAAVDVQHGAVLKSQGFVLPMASAEGQSLVFSERSPFGLVNVVASTSHTGLSLFIDNRSLCGVNEGEHAPKTSAKSEWQIGALCAE